MEDIVYHESEYILVSRNRIGEAASIYPQY